MSIAMEERGKTSKSDAKKNIESGKESYPLLPYRTGTTRRAQFATLRCERSDSTEFFWLGFKPATSESMSDSLRPHTLALLAWIRAKCVCSVIGSLHFKRSALTLKNFGCSRFDSGQVRKIKNFSLFTSLSAKPRRISSLVSPASY